MCAETLLLDHFNISCSERSPFVTRGGRRSSARHQNETQAPRLCVRELQSTEAPALERACVESARSGTKSAASKARSLSPFAAQPRLTQSTRAAQSEAAAAIAPTLRRSHHRRSQRCASHKHDVSPALEPLTLQPEVPLATASHLDRIRRPETLRSTARLVASSCPVSATRRLMVAISWPSSYARTLTTGSSATTFSHKGSR